MPKHTEPVLFPRQSRGSRWLLLLRWLHRRSRRPVGTKIGLRLRRRLHLPLRRRNRRRVEVGGRLLMLAKLLVLTHSLVGQLRRLLLVLLLLLLLLLVVLRLLLQLHQ